MFDIKFIRDHPDEFDAGLARRNLPPKAGEVLALGLGEEIGTDEGVVEGHGHSWAVVGLAVSVTVTTTSWSVQSVISVHRSHTSRM